jgi:hypothetical protein
MTRLFSVLAILVAFTTSSFAQKEQKEGSEKITVPVVVKTALAKKYPESKKVTWEREKGNYEANWGGKSGEDHSVQFTPSGNFIEIVKAIPVSSLPKSIAPYIATNYKGAKIKEAGKVTNAAGTQTYEVEIKGKDLIFDLNGNYLKKD